MNLTAASAWPLDLALYADNRRTSQRLRKSSVSFESNSGPSSLLKCWGTSKVAKAHMNPDDPEFCNPGLAFLTSG